MIERTPTEARAHTLARYGTRWAAYSWWRPWRAMKATRRPATVPTLTGEAGGP